MRVELNPVGSVTEPRIWVQHQPVLMMALRTGSIEVGSRRSEMMRLTFGAGEMCLIPRHFESWVRTDDLHYLYLSIGMSDVALAAACDRTSGDVELRRVENVVDARVGALAAAVNAERVAGFPSGRLFLDSVEQALAVALVDGYAVRHRSVQTHRGGLARFRSLAHDQRVRRREDRRRVDALRDGASGRVEPSVFLADVSQVNRRDPASISPASETRACQRDIALRRWASNGCSRGLWLQKPTAFCAGLPSRVWS